jgi:hypothetical protein
MCDIPVDLERRFERRWAARFSGPTKEHRLEEQQHQLITAPNESRRARERGPKLPPIIPRTVASPGPLTSR